MGFEINYHRCLLCAILVLLPVLCYSDGPIVRSRATYYSSPDGLGTPKGACGFGDYGRTVNDGNVAGVSRLFKNGAGCGACYKVRCTAPQCSDEGVNVVVTDYGEGDRTDFILSTRAYKRMARPNMVAKLFAYGVVDIEYRRIPCRHSGYNIKFKVHENSKFPDYLAIVVLYVPGENEITAVEIWQKDRKQWIGMRRAYGAVFDIANPPRGSVNLRFQVSGSVGLKWVQVENAIPGDWRAGVAYESDIQLT